MCQQSFSRITISRPLYCLQSVNAGAELEIIFHLFNAHVLSLCHSKVIWLVTFAAVLCFGLDLGLAIAIGFAFLLITIRLHRHLQLLKQNIGVLRVDVLERVIHVTVKKLFHVHQYLSQVILDHLLVES